MRFIVAINNYFFLFWILVTAFKLYSGAKKCAKFTFSFKLFNFIANKLKKIKFINQSRFEFIFVLNTKLVI